MNTKITLIIPDIHHKVDLADKIIKHVGADVVICLGDVFDDFNDDANMVQKSAEWLVDFVKKPNHIFCWGNHDMHYAFPERWFQCSGFEMWKYNIISNIVSHECWDKLKYYHILDKTWLLTHAGLHNLHLPSEIANLKDNRSKFLESISKCLDDEIIKGRRNESWIFHAGRSRGGHQRVGGITWCDYEREFHPIAGLNQIFGHTPQSCGIAKWCVWNGNSQVTYHPTSLFTPENITSSSKSFNLGLDVHGNMHWATWNGKTLSIFNYKDDM